MSLMIAQLLGLLSLYLWQWLCGRLARRLSLAFYAREPDCQEPLLGWHAKLARLRFQQSCPIEPGSANGYSPALRTVFVQEYYLLRPTPLSAGIILHELGHHRQARTRWGRILQHLTILADQLWFCPFSAATGLAISLGGWPTGPHHGSVMFCLVLAHGWLLAAIASVWLELDASAWSLTELGDLSAAQQRIVRGMHLVSLQSYLLAYSPRLLLCLWLSWLSCSS